MNGRRWLRGRRAAPARARHAAAADDATLLRVFLTDGTSLVSYGELARVGDRVVFSMPTATDAESAAASGQPAAARVDWDRTNRYPTTARAAHYIATQAEADYAALSNSVAHAERRRATRPTRATRLAIVDGRAQDARRLAAEPLQLPPDRSAADAGDARRGDRRSAGATGRRPVRPQPCRPSPIRRRCRRAAAAAADAARSDRAGAAGGARRRQRRRADIAALVGGGRARSRQGCRSPPTGRLRHGRRRKRRCARNCASTGVPGVHGRTMAVANYRAQQGDVRGLERLLRTIPQRDALLGGKRPDAVEGAGRRGRGETRCGAAAAAGARSVRDARAGAARLPRRDPHADGSVRAAEAGARRRQGAVGIDACNPGAGGAQRRADPGLAAAIVPPEKSPPRTPCSSAPRSSPATPRGSAARRRWPATCRAPGTPRRPPPAR